MTSDFGFNGIRPVPPPVNEPVKAYAPGSPERAELKARLQRMAQRAHARSRSSSAARRSAPARRGKAVMPHDHGHVLADWHKAGEPKTSTQAIAAAREARREWSRWPWEDRAAVFLKAAELLADHLARDRSTPRPCSASRRRSYQAEIDSACELIDFWRFNAALRRRSSTPSSRVSRPRRCGTSSTTGRSRASSSRSRRSTSPSIAGNLPTAPGADGQHRGVEAGVERDAERATTS